MNDQSQADFQVNTDRTDAEAGTVAFIYNTAKHVERARKNLIEAIIKAGHQVVLISPYDSSVPRLEALGVVHEPIRMTQYGINPFTELRALVDIRRALGKHRPFVCLNYTIKPNTIGNFAARSFGIPTINNIAGSGRAFTAGSHVRRMFFKALFRLSLRRSSRVFFQNDDDKAVFLESGMVRPDVVGRLPGSGVDLKHHSFDPILPRTPTFLFLGRLLKEKGADLFLQEARRINRNGAHAEFLLAGDRMEDPGYVSEKDITSFTQTDGCRYLGVVQPDDVPTHIRAASFVVLPSLYGEGVPRCLLEACATGRPIITTNSVGCKDVLVNGVNGFEVDPRRPFDLANVIQRAIELEPAKLQEMGREARLLAETKFDERLVISAYSREIKAALSNQLKQNLTTTTKNNRITT